MYALKFGINNGSIAKEEMLLHDSEPSVISVDDLDRTELIALLEKNPNQFRDLTLKTRIFSAGAETTIELNGATFDAVELSKLLNEMEKAVPDVMLMAKLHKFGLV